MFKIVGLGVYPKDNFIDLLKKWGIIDPSPFVLEAEEKGRVICGNYRVLHVRIN